MEIYEIKKTILEKFPISKNKGSQQEIWKQIQNFDSSLRLELETFLKTGDLPLREENGFTVKKLIDEYGMNPIGAFLTLDWIIKKPKEALKALAHGFDEIK